MQIMGYMGDLVPGLVPDPHARIALMRKGGTVRASERAPPPPQPVRRRARSCETPPPSTRQRLTRGTIVSHTMQVRVSEYMPPGAVANKMVFGLAWDITGGKNVDLDASAIMLDAAGRPFDLVWFQNLASKDGAIRHGGDEREGDAAGDDEKIFLDLSKVDASVKVRPRGRRLEGLN